MSRRWKPGRGSVVLVVLVVLVALAMAGRDTGEEDSAERPATSTTVSGSAPSTATVPEAVATTTSSTTAPPTTTLTTAPPTGPGSPASPVDQLVVAAPDPTLMPYRRASFGDGWAYDPASGCNTRERVLIEESLVPATVDDRCRPTGRWRSAYDGVVTTDIADLEVDHFVPLADAWRAGAATWTPERREAFANDLGDPNTLIAVTSRTNRSKSDSTPDQWLPPQRGGWCDYAADWVEVKLRWQLSATPAEKAVLVRVLDSC